MKTLLVLAQHPEFAEAVLAAVNPDTHRIDHRISLDEAETLLHGSLFNACVMDVESSNVHWVWMIEKLRRRIAPVRDHRLLRGEGLRNGRRRRI